MTTPTTVNARFQLRADTAANWASVNPTLLTNELGLETDTKKLKVGNGSTAWNSLAYFPSIVSGGTVLGNLEIGTTGTLTFEGSTADGFETTLAVTNPTADRTITLPNQSGTVLVSGNASITNADIAANAEIAVSKLADGAARQLLQTDAAGTGVEWTDNVDIPGTLDVTGAATFDNNVTITGDLTVNGTTTNINTQNLVVEDKNIILGDVATPTDVTADGGGITLKGATDKTINWVDSTDAWTSSERFSVPLGSAGAPSLTFTGDPNTGIYSPGADQLALSTGGTERGRVDSSGRLLVGTSSARTNYLGGGTAPSVQLEATNFPGSSLSLTRNETSGAGAGLLLGRTRSVANNSNTAVVQDDGLGIVSFQGADGTNLIEGARISAAVDGTPGVNDMPGRLIFSTTADGASSPTERMRIDSSGRVGIGTTDPVEKLEVRGGNIGLDSAGSVVGDRTTERFYKRTDNGSSNGMAAIGMNGAGTNGFLGEIKFYTGASDVFNASLSERMRLDSSGRLGIGTTSPGSTLDVNGTIRAANYHVLDGSTSAAGVVGFSTSNGPSLEFWGSAAAGGGSLIAKTAGSERARIDSSGRLLVGTSSSLSAGNWSDSLIQVRGNSSGSTFEGKLALFTGRTIAAGIGAGESLGRVAFGNGEGGEAAWITAQADAGWSASDYPGRLVFSTTADGASSPTEKLRITNDGVHAYNQGAPAAVNATATLTVANLKTGIITSTSAAATDMTLPTGTDTEAGFSGIYTNMTFEWSVINTGPSLVRVLAGTAHTIVGSGSVATGTSGRFASRRTAANTFVTYRLS